jgi:hypothetical protein
VRARWLVLLLASAASADRVVERDGTILSGAAEVAGGVVRIGGKAIDLEGVCLVERDDGALVYAHDYEARLRGYEYIAQAYLRDEYTKITRECCQVGDFVLARRMLERAEHAGLASREAIALKQRIERDEQKRGGGGDVKSERLLKRAGEIDAHFASVVAERARRELDGGKDGARLLREALRLQPDLAPAAELLARLAPRDFPIGDSRVWLDWHVDLEQAGAKIVTGEAPALERARKLWRKDLHGVHAGEILLLTPVKDPYLVGRCLAHGQLACRVLGELFTTKAPVRTAEGPMLIFLFGSRDEYKSTTGTGGRVEDPLFLEWTAGHYSPGERVSRFFWVADPDAERRLVGTCMHELTHQWIEERNPRVVPSPSPVQRGYWIVEGFATFMEEGVYDVGTGEYNLYNPRSHSLDVLRAVDKRNLIPWKDFYALTQADFSRLPGDDQIVVTLRWWLQPHVISLSRMFYEQAGATCQFLFHGEEGRHREALLRYVDSWYDGKGRGMDIKEAFGMSAEELGAKVVAFATAQ